MPPSKITAAITTNPSLLLPQVKHKNNKKKAKKNEVVAKVEQDLESSDIAEPGSKSNPLLIDGMNDIRYYTIPPPSLFYLPAEVRMIIYQYLFVDAQIVVQHSGKASAVEVQIFRESGASTAVLRTNKLICREAMTVLRHSISTISVENTYNTSRRLVMLEIPKVWRDSIRTINYNALTPTMFLYLPDYANLREIHLATKMFKSGSRRIAQESTINQLVMNHMEIKISSLKHHGRDWLPKSSKVMVTVRILVFNRNKDVSNGWVFYIDVAHWRIARRSRAQFTLDQFIPTETYYSNDAWHMHLQRLRWRKMISHWQVELME